MSDLFTKIGGLIPGLHGWCTLPKATTLASAVLALRPAVSVEIGVYGGRSFIPIALAHKEIGFGMVWGIDPWSPSESVLGQINQADKDYWGTLNHDEIMHGFLKLLRELELESCSRIFHSPSNTVEPPAQIDLFHLDGNHSDQAVKDVERFASRVRIGGLAFLDDIHWSGGGVERAVEKLKSLGFVRLYDLDTGAAFQRIAANVVGEKERAQVMQKR